MRFPILFPALGAILLASCGAKEAREPRADVNAAPVAVQSFAAQTAEWPVFYEATGTVRARSAAVISSKVMGYVREVAVRVGDRVRAGQPLVRLDARDLETQYRQAEAARNEAQSGVAEADQAIAAARANLELAQVTFKRMNDLFEKRSISNQEFDEAAAKLKVAGAGYEMAMAKKTQLGSRIAQAEQGFRGSEIMRGYAELAAPFAGVVTEKTVEPGNLAAPGAPLLTIEAEGAYRLEAAVEESKLSAIRPGQTATIVLDAIGHSLDGKVSEIVPAVDAASRAFTVKIDLPASPLIRSGLFGRARFALGTRQVLSVPLGAVIQRGQLASVFVAGGGLARARLVSLGATLDGRVEVLSGLTAGDRVIFPAPEGLVDGAKVEVRQ
jgi:membrane fusion protein, multidrug efflux system